MQDVCQRKAEREKGKAYGAFIADLYSKRWCEFYSSEKLVNFGEAQWTQLMSQQQWDQWRNKKCKNVKPVLSKPPMKASTSKAKAKSNALSKSGKAKQSTPKPAKMSSKKPAVKEGCRVYVFQRREGLVKYVDVLVK